MQNNITDKEILYSMIEREVSNIFQGVPIFSAFEKTINSYIIKFIDPYVSAFIDPNNLTLDSEQLSAFASEEVEDKIKAFKEKYNNMKGTLDNAN